MSNLVGVRFKALSKIYDFDAQSIEVKKGDQVIVEVDKGIGLGEVVKKYDEGYKPGHDGKLKRVVRVADKVDFERLEHNKEKESGALKVCKDLVTKYSLKMKLVNVEYLFDSSKAIFNFIADDRVDFRRLVKDLAARLHTRIEMRQIGVRDEARLIGAVGPCGRALCCSSFLSSFAPVTVKMAKEQGLVLNPQKISGICGRLMCCLAYEHEGGKSGKNNKGGKPNKNAKPNQGGGCGSGGCGNGGGCAGGTGAGALVPAQTKET